MQLPNARENLSTKPGKTSSNLHSNCIVTAKEKMLPLDIGGVGDEFAVLGEDGAEGEDEGLALEIEGGVLGCFDDDLEGLGGGAGRGGQDAAVTGMDDALDGVESIDEGAFVAREGSLGGGEGGLHQLLGEGVAADEAVHAVAGVVGVEGDDAIEGLELELGLEEGDFGLAAIGPEVAVEIEAGPAVAGVIDVAGGVAKGINPELEFLAEGGIGIELADEIDEAERTGGFIAMDAGEDADFDAGLDDVGALEDETGQPEAILAGAPETEGIGPERIRGADLEEEGEKDFFDRLRHAGRVEMKWGWWMKPLI